ncbi:hypothetical protein Pcinc_009925 [Petrolisthes cinctipes]|uniref:Alpha 1,4-glycosyltransferase domain-containing protein n=1 Tax=Petrolisthes cinctipes TaxID=88211 RepID=A0AAE1KVZ7_PETCI|nr:hypothetical protein Pcinc_009925 [Petrolisthes cinctipes]
MRLRLMSPRGVGTLLNKKTFQMMLMQLAVVLVVVVVGVGFLHFIFDALYTSRVLVDNNNNNNKQDTTHHEVLAWPAQLLSDMVRVCVLWRWGGIYSDTDAMCTRTHTLPLNAVAFESESVIGTAVLTFTSQHPTLWKLMKAMDLNIIMFSSSYALHMWNFFSKDMVVRAGSESIYDQAAQFLCPIVYSRATLHSDVV